MTAQDIKLLMKAGSLGVFVALVQPCLPNELIDLDEVLAKLEEARLKGK